MWAQKRKEWRWFPNLKSRPIQIQQLPKRAAILFEKIAAHMDIRTLGVWGTFTKPN